MRPPPCSNAPVFFPFFGKKRTDWGYTFFALARGSSERVNDTIPTYEYSELVVTMVAGVVARVHSQHAVAG